MFVLQIGSRIFGSSSGMSFLNRIVGVVEDSSKKEKGLMDRDESLVIAGGGSIRVLNGNGKSTIKFF